MKIAKPRLFPGDTVSVSVTHEIKIDGETSWIKQGAASTVQSNETEEDARARVAEVVNEGVMKTVMETVDKVRSIT